MQHQGQTFSLAVERVPKQGMSDGLEMYTYLMSPAGKQFYAHQGKVPVLPEDGVIGTGIPALAA